MRQVSTIVFNRHDIQKMAIEYAKSLGYIPEHNHVRIRHDPKNMTDEQFQVTVDIKAVPKRQESQQQVQR